MFKSQSLVAAMAFALLGPMIASAQHKEDDGMMKKCAQICSTCQIECDSCFSYCLQMVADGKLEHKETAQFCGDCAECCKACATLCARSSPLSKHMLECCAKC